MQPPTLLAESVRISVSVWVQVVLSWSRTRDLELGGDSLGLLRHSFLPPAPVVDLAWDFQRGLACEHMPAQKAHQFEGDICLKMGCSIGTSSVRFASYCESVALRCASSAFNSPRAADNSSCGVPEAVLDLRFFSLSTISCSIAGVMGFNQGQFRLAASFAIHAFNSLYQPSSAAGSSRSAGSCGNGEPCLGVSIGC